MYTFSCGFDCTVGSPVHVLDPSRLRSYPGTKSGTKLHNAWSSCLLWIPGFIVLYILCICLHVQ